jgi:hypothetical protein
MGAGAVIPAPTQGDSEVDEEVARLSALVPEAKGLIEGSPMRKYVHSAKTDALY